MKTRIIYLISSLCMVMGVYATPELAQEPMAVAPQAKVVEVVMSQPNPRFKKNMGAVVVPQPKAVAMPISMGAPLRQTSSAVLKSSNSMSTGGAAGAIVVAGGTSFAPTVAIPALPMVTKVNTRTSFSKYQYAVAENTANETPQLTKRNAPTLPPWGEEVPLPDAVWLLLLLAATYALFLRQRSKTL